jgi:hypothetical protein
MTIEDLVMFTTVVNNPSSSRTMLTWGAHDLCGTYTDDCQWLACLDNLEALGYVYRVKGHYIASESSKAVFKEYAQSVMEIVNASSGALGL